MRKVECNVANTGNLSTHETKLPPLCGAWIAQLVEHKIANIRVAFGKSQETNKH